MMASRRRWLWTPASYSDDRREIRKSLFAKLPLRNCFAKGNRQDLGVVCRLPSRAVCIPAIPEVAMSRTRRRPYPSDLSDAEWALLEPLLASPERRGRPPKWSARRIAD